MEGGPTFLRRLFDMEALIDEAMCRCSGVGDNLSVDNCGSCWWGNVSKGQNPEVFESPVTDFGCTGTGGLSERTSTLTCGWQRLEHRGLSEKA